MAEFTSSLLNKETNICKYPSKSDEYNSSLIITSYSSITNTNCSPIAELIVKIAPANEISSGISTWGKYFLNSLFISLS